MPVVMGMRFALIQQAESSPPGTLLPFFESSGVEVHHVRVGQGDPVPQSSAPFDGVVVLGGPMAAWEDVANPHLKPTVELLRDCTENDEPVLAICLGAQLLARAAGARNYRSRDPEVGWYGTEITEAGRADPLLRGLPPTFPTFMWHFDTFDAPPGASVLARTAGNPLAAFRLAGRQWGVVFHPEKDQATIRTQLGRHRKSLTTGTPPVDVDRVERETRDLEPDHARRAARLFGNFLDAARG
jgi:GMP synthase-like glutamine amidotransferase